MVIKDQLSFIAWGDYTHTPMHAHTHTMYSGKVWLVECLVEKVWRMNRSAKELLIVVTNLMVLVWRIADDSPNSANFLPPNVPAIQ